MATRVIQVRYYIKEWIEHLKRTDDEVADKLGLSGRSALWKLYTEQHRLAPQKVSQIARELGVHPSDLLFPPEVPSLDALAEGATPEQRAAMVRDIARHLRK